MRHTLKKLAFVLASISCVWFSAQAQSTWPPELIITPEKSDFVKTSTHADVMQFLSAIKEKSPYVQIFSMGKSQEGKEIPVAILGKPAIHNAEEAKLTGKPIIYIQGNIHAGEVEGKEAVMMLMRDILLGEKQNLLDNQIILFAPIYNTDSNDKMERGRRPSQEDSPLEIGIRENSQGLDLNRDGIKMEAFESQALFNSVVTVWDPHLFVDLHTTNGTWHAYSLTWAPAYHYAGEYATYDFVNNNMLPSITNTAKEKYGLFFGPYGDYYLQQGWPPKNFYTYNHHPRYLVNQFSLRNRLAILSEAFSHERFYQRIFSTYTFVYEILDYTNRYAREVVSVTQKADEDAIKNIIENAGKVKKGVRFKMVPFEKLEDFRTYDYVKTKKEDGSDHWLRTGNIVTYKDVTYHAKFEATVESTVPRGYIIPAEFSAIAEHLRKLGIKVDQLSKTKSFSGEVFQVDTLVKSPRKFEGHYMRTGKGKFVGAKREFKKGDFVIDAAQPLANLIFYVLEPQSDDGLLTWNFFDAYLENKGVGTKPVEYPVFKYFK